MEFITILFWLGVLGVAYIYAGYPLLIGMLARLFPKPVAKEPNNLSLSIIMSVHNEAPRIKAKVLNLLAAEQADRIREILIGSDGSTDRPGDSLDSTCDPRVRMVEFKERRGKPSVLNDLIPQASGDVLVMMDVRQRLDAEALPALLANFSDPSIGVVSGELVFDRSDEDSAAAGGIDAYWTYEKWIRDREGRFQSVPGATGALYAIRQELTRPIPADAALDDVILPMQAISQGYRCIFDPEARIYDRPEQDPAREAIRKRRTLAGCVQLLRFYPQWCIPGMHPIAWQFASHKIARLFSPACLMLIFITSLANLTHPFFTLCVGLQVVCYSLAVAGSRGYGGRPGGIAYLFLEMQRSLMQAWVDGLRSRNLALWRKA